MFGQLSKLGQKNLFKRKTPAYAVLTTFLNLNEKWAPVLLL